MVFSLSGKKAKRILLYLIILGVLFVLAINLAVSSYSRKFILDPASPQSPFAKDDKEIPVALVLGASVYSNGKLSPILEERVKKGLELYEAGKVEKILVSGDNSQVTYNEVIPIRQYLLDKGVPAEDVFTDFAGFNTYDSMTRAGQIFGVKNVLVVSQRFHLPRAIYAARHVGLNAYGIPADVKSPSIRNNVREVGATVKTFFEVATGAEPTGGRFIPVEGDGRESLK